MTLCVCGHRIAWSQNTQIIAADQEPYNPESLIRNYFIGEGVQILDIKFEGSPKATGYFQNGLQDIGIEQGIVLGTGNIDKIDNPNTSESSTLTSNTDVINAELNNIIGIDTLKDVITYEITFIPSADTIQFNYVFASEEYPEYVCSNFNDVFGFFISGPNPNGGDYASKNIAIVPGTSNLPVSINNVNNGMAGSSGNAANCASNANLNYSEFYNTVNSAHLTFDGILDPFIAAAKVVACETYTIKFSIGDANDFLKDSAVFLQGKSFSSNAVDVKAVTVSANGTITEGCTDATLVFELPFPAIKEEIIPFSLIGTAINGTDYTSLPSDISIPLGQTSASISISPIEDNEAEPLESVGIIVTKGACNKDTIWVGIEDNLLAPPTAVDPIFLCNGNTTQVDFTIPFDPPTPSVFRNQNSMRIEPINTPIYSTIKVENIYPSTLNQTDFIQVCIDELSHPWIEDLSIYLYGPNNQFIELTSKNGGNGGNGTATDFYLNTCFTFDASQLISDANFVPPYIGNFQPEGNWDDLFGSSAYKVNGNWRLMLIDDFQGSVGTLSSWSIHFGKSYDINYSWTPNVGISCIDCPNPTFSPTESQNYMLKIEDSNGCSLDYEVMVNTGDAAPSAPTLLCDNSENNTLTFSWEDVPGALSYQISVNGGLWADLDQAQIYIADNLEPGTSITLEVQAVGECADGEIAEISCATVACAIQLEQIDIVNPNCHVTNSGSIEVSAQNGVAPITYILSDVDNNIGVFENLVAGEYLISAIDANGCKADILISLESTEAILIEAEIDHVTCDEETGSINLTITGGNGQLEYQWSDNFTGDASMLLPGTYDLIVIDESGCSQARALTVERTADFIINFEVKQPDCSDAASGQITLFADVANLLDNVVWNNGATTSTLENLSAGSYIATITDQIGCELIQTFELQAANEIEFQSISENIICQGESSGQASVNITEGNEPFEIKWSNGSTGSEISNLSPGMYIAEISDGNGCSAVDTIFIMEPELLELSSTEVTPMSCNNDFGSISVNAIGGTPPYKYSLNNSELSEESQFNNLEAGTYMIEIFDSNGCKDTSNEEINLMDYEEINLLLDDYISLSLGDSVRLNAIVSNRNGNIRFEWYASNVNMLSCLDCYDPMLYAIQSGSLEVLVEDENGCSVIQFATIQVDNTPEVYVPNAFSPNSDGINDKLNVYGKQSQIAQIDQFSIYDKWGNELYTDGNLVLNSTASGWDGNYKGAPLDNGVFIWTLTVTLIDGRTEQLSGDVTLLR